MTLFTHETRTAASVLFEQTLELDSAAGTVENHRRISEDLPQAAFDFSCRLLADLGYQFSHEEQESFRPIADLNSERYERLIDAIDANPNHPCVRLLEKLQLFGNELANNASEYAFAQGIAKSSLHYRILDNKTIQIECFGTGTFRNRDGSPIAIQELIAAERDVLVQQSTLDLDILMTVIEERHRGAILTFGDTPLDQIEHENAAAQNHDGFVRMTLTFQQVRDLLIDR